MKRNDSRSVRGGKNKRFDREDNRESRGRRLEREGSRDSKGRRFDREDSRESRGKRLDREDNYGRKIFDSQNEYSEFEKREDKSLIIGRNPVIEALNAEREIEKLIVAKGATEGSIRKILAMAKDQRIPITYAEKIALDRISGASAHQGVIAIAAVYEYKDVEDMFSLAKERGEEPFLIILDNLEDPHNLGAIIRTAEAAGAHGVIIPKRRSAGLTETVAKASAGAIEYVPVAKVSNIAQTIEKLKDRGVWIAACDMGDTMYYEANLKGAIAIVIGSEGFGIGKLVREKCDFVVSMPMMGKITSLNASNAAAVLLYEIRRQRSLYEKL